MWIPTQRRKYCIENTSLQNQTVNKSVQNETKNVQRKFANNRISLSTKKREKHLWSLQWKLMWEFLLSSWKSQNLANIHFQISSFIYKQLSNNLKTIWNIKNIKKYIGQFWKFSLKKKKKEFDTWNKWNTFVNV